MHLSDMCMKNEIKRMNQVILSDLHVSSASPEAAVI